MHVGLGLIRKIKIEKSVPGFTAIGHNAEFHFLMSLHRRYLLDTTLALLKLKDISRRLANN